MVGLVDRGDQLRGAGAHQGDRVLGGGGAEHVCPAKIGPDKTRQIQELALRAFGALGLVVYSRVDVLLSDSGDPFVLEVNTIPGMTEASLLPEAAAAAGISYVDLCARIMALSRARTERSRT